MPAKHVGYAITSFTYHLRGGLRVVHDTAVKYLARQGFLVTPIYGPPGAIVEPEKALGSDVYVSNVAYTTWYYGKTTSVAVSASKPRKVVWHGYVEGVPNIPPKAAESLREKAIFVAPTNFVRERLEEAGFRVRAVINPGIDLDRMRYSELKARTITRMKRGRILLLYIANNVPRKGIERLVEAYKIVYREGYKNTLLYILTDRPPNNVTDEIRNNIVVDLSMFSLDDEYIATLYKACDIYVHASMSEGLGLPIMEAQVMGKPVVIVDAPPMNEICRDRWCFRARYRRREAYWWMDDEVLTWIHVYEPEDLAKAIMDAIDSLSNLDEEEIARVSRERFDSNNTLRELEEIIDEAIEEVER